MNLQTVAQTSGNNWHDSYSFQRAYERPQPRPRLVPLREIHAGLTYFAAPENEMADFRAAQEAILKALQSRFGKATDAPVATFLANHRSLPHLLTEAFDKLRDTFGAGLVVNLELSTDEEGCQTLYVIILWKEEADGAAAAFNSFVEDWWIHKMGTSTSDLAFVYQLI